MLGCPKFDQYGLKFLTDLYPNIWNLSVWALLGKFPRSNSELFIVFGKISHQIWTPTSLSKFSYKKVYNILISCHWKVFFRMVFRICTEHSQLTKINQLEKKRKKWTSSDESLRTPVVILWLKIFDTDKQFKCLMENKVRLINTYLFCLYQHKSGDRLNELI